MLQSLDTHWREHLSALDHLRQGIHLRGYAQKNPKQEYKREAFELFTAMLEEIKAEVTRTLMTVQIRSEQQVEAVAETQQQPVNVQYHHAAYEEVLGEEELPGGRRSPGAFREAPAFCAAGPGRSAGTIPAHVDQEKNINSATASSARGLSQHRYVRNSCDRAIAISATSGLPRFIRRSRLNAHQ